MRVCVWSDVIHYESVLFLMISLFLYSAYAVTNLSKPFLLFPSFVSHKWSLWKSASSLAYFQRVPRSKITCRSFRAPMKGWRGKKRHRFCTSLSSVSCWRSMNACRAQLTFTPAASAVLRLVCGELLCNHLLHKLSPHWAPPTGSVLLMYRVKIYYFIIHLYCS